MTLEIWEKIWSGKDLLGYNSQKNINWCIENIKWSRLQYHFTKTMKIQEKISWDIEELKDKMSTIGDQMTQIDKKQEQMHDMVHSTYDAVIKFMTAHHSSPSNFSLVLPHSHFHAGCATSSPPALKWAPVGQLAFHALCVTGCVTVGKAINQILRKRNLPTHSYTCLMCLSAVLWILLFILLILIEISLKTLFLPELNVFANMETPLSIAKKQQDGVLHQEFPP